jgi:hypothetical protein
MKTVVVENVVGPDDRLVAGDAGRLGSDREAFVVVVGHAGGAVVDVRDRELALPVDVEGCGAALAGVVASRPEVSAGRLEIQVHDGGEAAGNAGDAGETAAGLGEGVGVGIAVGFDAGEDQAAAMAGLKYRFRDYDDTTIRRLRIAP